MINYVIINGVNSNTKNGLMINELPPISKPQMRNDIEEIDGRDGDIITKLGYSAYDKTITIGLWGTSYDVNDIIAFFNKEGIITFSNEPDKYYKFTMLDDFDIETLLRFKTASITFHCQPYKYPTEETPIEIEYEYIEQDNVESASLNNTNGDSHLDITLKGNTSQYTTTGKNKLPISLISTQTNANITITNLGDGTIKINGTGTGQYVDIPYNYELQANTGYKWINFNKLSGADANISFRDSSNNSITFIGIASDNKTYTPSSNQQIATMRLFLGTTAFNNFILKTMFIKSSDTETWEEYTNGASPNPSYPQPINVVSGDNEVVVCGKNLFDYHSILNNMVEGKIINANGIEVSDETSRYSTYKIKVKANDILHFKGMIQRVYYWKSDNTWVGRIINVTNYDNPINTSYTFEYDGYIEFQFRNNYATEEYLSQCLVAYSDIQYEPYQSQTYPINLGELELCKIGDYEDKIFKAIKGNEIYDSLTTEEQATLDYGSWYLRKAVGKVVLNGSENYWNVSTSYDTYNFYAYNTSLSAKNEKLAKFCDLFTYSGLVFSEAPIPSLCENTNVNYCMFIFRTDGTYGTTVAQWKTWLSTHNTTVYYVLATPTNTEITDNTLIEQLEALKSAYSYDTQTNISQTNNDKPFIMDLIAMKDGTDEVVVNNIGNTYSKPTIALEGTGDINIYLNGTQMLKATLTDKMTIDTTNLEAYNPDTMTLLNRQLVGDISKFTLSSGNNTIKVDGNLTKATITDYVRYL